MCTVNAVTKGTDCVLTVYGVDSFKKKKKIINVLVDSHTGHCGRRLLSALLLANIVSLGESTVTRCNRSYLFAVVRFFNLFFKNGK